MPAQLLSWRAADTSRKQARSREADAKARLRMLKGNEDATGATGAGKHEGRAAARHSKRPEPELNQEDTAGRITDRQVAGARQVVSRRVAITRDKQHANRDVAQEPECRRHGKYPGGVLPGAVIMQATGRQQSPEVSGL